MKITIPPIVRPIQLSDYVAELSPGVVQVWVNPPRDVIDQYNPILESKTGTETKIAEWYAAIWSKGPDVALHWTPAEVIALSQMDTDPAFLRWLLVQTWALINDHRALSKKK